jgi:hypothetical protein
MQRMTIIKLFLMQIAYALPEEELKPQSCFSVVSFGEPESDEKRGKVRGIKTKIPFKY